jgi:hypothetical protein
MTLQTSDFPQADRLEKVGDVARAVATGLRSDAEIEDFIGLESADRQGRYYRKAAELLDLVKTAQNRSELMDNGRIESPRDCRRLHTVRGWSHAQILPIFA